MNKKIFLAHNSCLNAAYDLNVLRAGIEAAGHQLVDRPELADEIVFSGCSVREHWVDDAINQLDQARLRSPEARIVITGCIANTSRQIVQSRMTGGQLSFLPIQEVLLENSELSFAEVDRRLSQEGGNSFEPATANGLHSLRRRVGETKYRILAMLDEEDRRHGTHFVRNYRQTTKGFVFYDEQESCEMITVTRSCPYQCSFCNIPLGRGDFVSVPLQDIVAKAQAAVANGRHHIILIGDEVGNYGIKTGGARFPEMIQAVLSLHPSVTISIRYIEPKPFLKYFEKLLFWGKAGRLQLLYISLQSGSQRLLKAMRRGYDIDRIAKALREFRQSCPTILYGNWLVGFPGEQEEDFQATVSLVRDLDFHINVAIPFSPRPGTPAWVMADQVDPAVIDIRVNTLTEVASELKVALMSQYLAPIASSQCSAILELVWLAEYEQYVPNDQLPAPRPVIPLVLRNS
ncbi:radical SAM protein [Iodobacter ciconiae]|nr:radical SAM protein [Iodobacter ciconiae]